MKPTRSSVKTYQLDASGNYNLIDDEALDETNNMQIIDNETINKEILYTNPFLFNIEKSNGCYVASIEDFYLQDNNQAYNMGLILRNDELKKGKRNKIIKKNFKRWKKEINDRLQFVLTNANNKLLEASSNKVIGVKFINKFLLIVSIVICLLLLFNTIKIIKPLGNVFKIITIVIMLLGIIGLILSIIQEVIFILHLRMMELQ